MNLTRRRNVAVSTIALVTAQLVLGSLGAAPAHAADKDCGDFASQKAAQIFFLENGGPTSDPHLLDAEGDGIACETNPAPYYLETVLPDGSTATTTIRQRAKVIEVVDGDTLKVRLTKSGVRKKVRLIGIDTPRSTAASSAAGRGPRSRCAA